MVADFAGQVLLEGGAQDVMKKAAVLGALTDFAQVKNQVCCMVVARPACSR